MATYKDVLMLVDKVTEPLKKINKQTQQTTEKMQNMKKQLKDIGGKFVAFAKKATLAFTIVSTALTFALKKTADYGDRIDKMSQKIGMSRKAFQEWDYIMSQNGGNVESLQMGFKTLTTQIEGVQKGSKDSIKAFSSLGVSVKDANGQFRSQDEIFNDTIRKLQRIKNPTQKAMLANRLFGRSAAELRPLLNQEASAVDELREKANKLGLIVDEQDIKNAVILKDTFDTFGRAFQARFATVMMKVMPVFTKLLEKITPLIKFITDKIIDLGKQMIATPAFAIMKEQFELMAEELKYFYYENKDFFDALKTVFVWIVTNGIPNFITSLVMTTRALIKVIQTVKNFFSWIGGAIGNLVGWFLSIPTSIETAFINAQNIILRVFIALKRSIGDAIGYIIERLAKMLQTIGAIAGKIPGLKGLGDAITDIGNGITNNSVRQTQNNNTVNNSTTIKNYYGGQSTMQNKPKFNTAYVAP
jgi:archaellum component FlaC